MTRSNMLPILKLSGQRSVAVVGSCEISPDRISSLVFRAEDHFATANIVRYTAGLEKEFSARGHRILAFVGIGFGPVPTDNFTDDFFKGKFIEADHPRQPPGVPEGGEFRSAESPSDADEVTSESDDLANQTAVLKDLAKTVDKKVARRVLKMRLVAMLRGVAGTAADIVPYFGELFDGYEIVQTLKDFANLRNEAEVARAYVKDGPRTLDQLRASTDEKSFPSADAFKKIDALKKGVLGKYYGPAGDGYDYHHIVWQGGVNATKIPAQLLHSTENMVKVPRILHEAINDEYREIYENTGKSLRDWLDTQPYEVQREKGLEVMRKLGIIK